MPMHILSSHVEIIPKIEDVQKNLLQLDNKKDWNYDEATVSQIMFMYGSIQQAGATRVAVHRLAIHATGSCNVSLRATLRRRRI